MVYQLSDQVTHQKCLEQNCKHGGLDNPTTQRTRRNLQILCIMDKKNSPHLVDSLVSRLRKRVDEILYRVFVTKLEFLCDGDMAVWIQTDGTTTVHSIIPNVFGASWWKTFECIHPAMPFALVLLMIMKLVMFAEHFCSPTVYLETGSVLHEAFDSRAVKWYA